MKTLLLNIGFGNVVAADRVVAIVSPGSAPIKRLKEDAKEQGRLIDASYGRKTRSIIVTDSNHVILSAINPETAALRMMGKKTSQNPEDEDSDEVTLQDENIDETETDSTEVEV